MKKKLTVLCLLFIFSVGVAAQEKYIPNKCPEFDQGKWEKEQAALMENQPPQMYELSVTILESGSVETYKIWMQGKYYREEKSEGKGASVKPTQIIIDRPSEGYLLKPEDKTGVKTVALGGYYTHTDRVPGEYERTDWTWYYNELLREKCMRDNPTLVDKGMQDWDGGKYHVYHAMLDPSMLLAAFPFSSDFYVQDNVIKRRVFYDMEGKKPVFDVKLKAKTGKDAIPAGIFEVPAGYNISVSQ